MNIAVSRADLERRIVKLFGLTAEEAKSIMDTNIKELGLEQDGDAISGTEIDGLAKATAKRNRFDWLMN
jgi:hypothetical protein